MKISVVVLTYNRLTSLKNTITSIQRHTSIPYELLVVNNNSTDGTTEYLNGQLGIKAIHMPNNIGVVARNRAFVQATGDLIAQVDDDVSLSSGWDTTITKYFENSNVGMVGVQGGLIHKWMDLSVHQHSNNYVDFLTGFFLVFKNCGLMYDEEFGKFWHEELDLSLQFKSAGYKLMVHTGPTVCSHASLRDSPVDWELHNRNLDRVRTKWGDKLPQLSLEGMK